MVVAVAVVVAAAAAVVLVVDSVMGVLAKRIAVVGYIRASFLYLRLSFLFGAE